MLVIICKSYNWYVLKQWGSISELHGVGVRH